MATSFMRPLHLGHASTSTENVPDWHPENVPVDRMTV
jgi:hypothetical protein